MNIENAKPANVEWLNEVIQEEFPYTKFTMEKVASKINNPKYLILIARQENIMTGFCETEFVTEKKEARLNAIYVEESWRDQGIAKRMLAQIVNECKHRKITRLFLLVKESNTDAKALYEKTGFKFEKIHNKIIEGEKVEIWAQEV
ncbi:MAG: GNAT family N-acetyltransferase [archaeon]